MKTSKKLGIIGGLAGVTVGLGLTYGGLVSSQAAETWMKVQQRLEVAKGTTMVVVPAFTQGGGITATSTSGTTIPLVAANFDTENVIDVTLNVQDATLSFPATSTLTAFIPTAGQTRTLWIRNATTTATMDLTITGGTGVLLKKATTTAVVYGDTDGANYARIDLKRKANTDIEAILQIFMD